MKKRVGLSMVLLVLLLGSAKGQELSLFACWDKARAHYPLLKGKEALLTASALNMQQLRSQWLPRLEINGSIGWQNEVPSVDATGAFPGLTLPQAPKDQYQLALDVGQTLYDGGRTRAAGALEELQGAVAVQALEVRLQEVEQRVADLFFGLLMLDAQREQMAHKLEVLKARQVEVEALLRHGAVAESSLQQLAAEALSLRQGILELNARQESLLGSLSSFMGEPISDLSLLQKPAVKDLLWAPTPEEYAHFSLKRAQLAQQQRWLKRTRLPVVTAYGQLGYGNPGYNMLRDEFDTFYRFGLRLKWQPWDWKEGRRKQEVVEQQSLLVDLEEETFRVNTGRLLQQLDSELLRFEETLALDRELIALRKAIEETSAQQLQKGQITTATYLRDLDDRMEAEVNLKLHELEYLQLLTRKYLNGNEGYKQVNNAKDE